MKIQTSNKLAHLQVEYQELYEQTTMLQSQIKPMELQINQCQYYISVNSGDRKAVAQYRDLCRRYQTLVSQIKRNTIRLNNLQMRINQENQRFLIQQQRQQSRLVNRMGYR